MENLKTLPYIISELLSTKLNSLDLNTLILNHLPKMNANIAIADFPKFFREVYDSFDYFHIKKLYEEIAIFNQYDQSIIIDNLKNQSIMQAQTISTNFAAIKTQFANNKEIEKSIINISQNNQNFDNDETLKELNKNIGIIRKNTKKLLEEKNGNDRKPFDDFLIQIGEFEKIINKKFIIQQCIKNNVNLLSSYFGKNYNIEENINTLQVDIDGFLNNPENKPQNQNVEIFMNSFYEFQNNNSFIAPHVIDYIIEQNNPLKEIKESLFSKFSFFSLASNKKSLDIDTNGKNPVIEGMHQFFKDTDNTDYLINSHRDIIEFAIKALFGLDSDIIERLLSFTTDDLLISEEQNGYKKGGIQGLIRDRFKIDDEIIGNREEKASLMKNIQMLKVLMYFQLHNLSKNKDNLSIDEIKSLLQSGIDIWEKSLSSSLFKIYQVIEKSWAIKNLHNIAGWLPGFIVGQDVKENLLIIRKLQEDSIKEEKKKLRQYHDQLKIEIGNNEEKKQAAENRFNQEIIKLNEKLRLIQNSPTSKENIKNFFSEIANKLFVKNSSFELMIKLSEIRENNNIKTEKGIQNEINTFFTSIKNKKEAERNDYIEFVRTIGGEFFFKNEIRDEIEKYLKDKKNDKSGDATFVDRLKADFLLSDDAKNKILLELSKRTDAQMNVKSIEAFVLTLSQSFGSHASINIINIKDKIVLSREEIKEINDLITKSQSLTLAEMKREKGQKINDLAYKNDEKSLRKKTKLENELQILSNSNQDSREVKKIYLSWISKKLGVNIKDRTIVQSINKNLINGINEISEFKNLTNQEMTIDNNGLSFRGENKTHENTKKLVSNDKIVRKNLLSEKPQEKNKHGYIYSGIAGAAIACGALAIAGVFMKKDLSMENKVFTSLIITAFILVILIACVLSYKNEIPQKIFNGEIPKKIFHTNSSGGNQSKIV
jgi:hypothetical protein